MKKGFIAKLFASVTALTCAFSIAACSKDEPTKNDDGTNGSQTEKNRISDARHGNARQFIFSFQKFGRKIRYDGFFAIADRQKK